MTTDAMHKERTYHLSVSDRDLVSAPLDAVDRAILLDIEQGPRRGTPIADVLLGLELIVRRLEQALTPEEGS